MAIAPEKGAPFRSADMRTDRRTDGQNVTIVVNNNVDSNILLLTLPNHNNLVTQDLSILATIIFDSIELNRHTTSMKIRGSAVS